MKRISVRKIFPYDPTFDGFCSRYEGYYFICLGQKDPGIMRKLTIKVPKDVKKMFCSSLKRGTETAKAIDGILDINFKKTKYLNEVLFDLYELTSGMEFEKAGSSLVRKRFIEFFIKDKLEEKRSNIKRRILKILRLLDSLPDGNYLLISHSFFMKIMEIHIKSEGKLFEKPVLLEKYFHYKKKTYNFGEGFDFNL